MVPKETVMRDLFEHIERMWAMTLGSNSTAEVVQRIRARGPIAIPQSVGKQAISHIIINGVRYRVTVEIEQEDAKTPR